MKISKSRVFRPRKSPGFFDFSIWKGYKCFSTLYCRSYKKVNYTLWFKTYYTKYQYPLLLCWPRQLCHNCIFVHIIFCTRGFARELSTYQSVKEHMWLSYFCSIIKLKSILLNGLMLYNLYLIVYSPSEQNTVVYILSLFL